MMPPSTPAGDSPFSDRYSTCIGWLLLWLLVWTLRPPNVSAQSVPAAGAGHHPDRLMIGLAPGVTPDMAAAETAALGWEVTRVWPELALIEVTAQPRAAQATAPQAADLAAASQALLAHSPLFRYVDLDYQVQIAQTDSPTQAATAPNDPLLPDQWAFPLIGAEAAWGLSIGDERVAIAVLDTGYDTSHADLQASHLWVNPAEQSGAAGYDDDGNGYVDDLHGWDWVENDNEARDLHGHGTHVFGIIAAGVSNGIGVTGYGRNLSVAPLRVLDQSGTGYISDLVDALEYARAKGFRIANLSLTVSIDSPALKDAVTAARDAGILVVAAAGNTRSTVLWPAAYPETVAVAATTNTDEHADFSNYGSAIDIAAPGSSILSTYHGNTYRHQSGTSMAGPHVSVLAGLIWSLHPDWDASQVMEAITATAIDVNAASAPGWDSYLGAGRIDMYGALFEASGGINLRPVGETPTFAVSGAAVTVPLQASVPVDGADTPLQGAIVTYQLVNEADGLPVGVRGTAATDPNGRADLTFNTPEGSGAYQLLAQIGKSLVELPMTIHSHPVSVSLSISETAVAVGGAPIDFQVQVYGPDGVTETAPLPILLSTTLGGFADGTPTGSKELRVQVTNGVYQGQFIPGVVAGTTPITASIGASVAHQQVVIIPGPPATIIGPNPNNPAINVAMNVLKLNFLVQDAYGNAVADGVQVLFAASEGELTPASAMTAGGAVETTLTVAEGRTGTVRVTASVPDAGLETAVDVQITARLYFPIIPRTPGASPE
ncbi:MAG TPA: S8 family serine peptidase [Caldilineaceae bacterium]|nr:S8 family serine peptidase [Caldilineaceae bacterium]